jgi:hypothetical protein
MRKLDTFYFAKNKRDDDTYDICTTLNNGSVVVWSSIHCDFLLDSGISKFFDEIPDIIELSLDETMKFRIEEAEAIK